MREHMGLYRGKRVINDDWVEGSLLVCNLNNAYGPQIMWYTEEGLMGVDVDPDTVGECTGLTDKNGKLIFEGDIISIRFEDDYEPPSSPTVWYSLAKVVWSDNFHGWYAHFEGGGEIALWEYDDCDDVVVTDNIHDNPELLKGGEGE